jgi:uncharacterized membrane protein YczE
MNNKLKIVLQWLQICGGLLVFSLGVHLTIFANLGLAPWDCLGMGISYHTPLNYGLAMTGIAIVILVIDIALKEKIGFGTVIDALLTGNMIEMFNQLNPFELNTKIIPGLVYIIIGLALMAIGQYFYMAAGQGCGPRDTLLLGIGRRLKKIPIGIVELLIWAVVLLIGWLLGGPVGIGTLVSTFGAGVVMQLIYNLIHFEPRGIEHRSITKTIGELMTK